MEHVTGKSQEVSGFQNIAACRDGLKISNDKSATSPFVLGNWEISDVGNSAADSGKIVHFRKEA